MKIRKVILFRHLLVWVLYITYELLLIKITVGVSTPFFYYMQFYVLNVALFYFNAHVILDFAFFKTSRPYLIASCLIFLEIIAFLLIKLLLENYLAGAHHIIWVINPANIRLWLTNIFREIFFIGFSIAYWSMLYMVKFKEANHKMEKAHLLDLAKNLELENKYITAENAYLQNQISPHLLFNTLNFIYNSVHKVSDRAGRGIMLLSEIMRYSLISSTDQRFVPLKDEVVQVEKLIEISKLRYQDNFFLQMTQKGALKNIRILPLILVTLVENMIKHGDLGGHASPGKIRLYVHEGALSFKTRNKKRISEPILKSGIGLENIRKRLNNHYPDRHIFRVAETDDEFIIHLTLNLSL